MSVKRSKAIITNLEEDTEYIITVYVTIDGKNTSNYSKVTIRTHSDGKNVHISESMLCFIHTCTVPSSPPGRVTVIVINSTTLMVSFNPPPLRYHNGQLTGYVIRYNRVGSGVTKSVTTTTTTIFISGLDKFVNYSVTVASMNVNGTGPFSNPPVVQPTGKISCQPVTLQQCMHTVYLGRQYNYPIFLNQAHRYR